jgi:hypothetical protein
MKIILHKLLGGSSILDPTPNQRSDRVYRYIYITGRGKNLKDLPPALTSQKFDDPVSKN